MKLLRLTKRLFLPQGPMVAVEIAADRVTAVMLRRTATIPELVGYSTERLPPGAIVPRPSASNMIDGGVVERTLGAVLQRLPKRPARIGLVVPDGAAKVLFIRFDKTPTRSAELEQMIRWRVQQAVPDTLEKFQVSYTSGATSREGGREFVVVIMRRDIVEEYEHVCVAAGGQPGIVDLATLNLINVVLSGRWTQQSDDWVLLHATSSYNSIAIISGSALMFFRTCSADRPADLADLIHQTAMYYEDRLCGSGIRRVMLEANGVVRDGTQVEVLRKQLAETFRVPPEDIEAEGFRIAADLELTSLGSLAAPVGLVIRDQRLAA